MDTQIKQTTKEEQLKYWKQTNEKYRSKLKSKIHLLFRTCKKRAEKKQWDFDLTKEWIKEKIENGHCELSGEKFNCDVGSFLTHFHPFTPSIDRIDSSKGYTQENCRIVLAAINMGIGEWGLDQYLSIAKKVITYQKKCN
jgi:hypothetical protein